MAAVAEVSSPQRAMARRRKERELAQYVRQHRDRLESVAQISVNRVLYDRPPDPYAALLEQLSEHTQAGVRILRVRAQPRGQDRVTCEVLASARGAEVAAHRAELPKALVARGLAAWGLLGGHASESSPAPEVALHLSAALKGLAGVDILDFQEMSRRLGQLAEAGELAGVELRGHLSGLLLDAAGRLVGGTPSEAVAAALSARGLPVAQQLLCQKDLEVWQNRWPEFLVPALQGQTPRRRLLVGVTVWAATVPAPDVEAPQLVDEPAALTRRVSQEEAPRIEGEEEEPDPDEYCPPLNAVPIVVKLATLLAAKTAGEGPALKEGEDFGAALNTFRSALEALVPTYAESEAREQRVRPEEEGDDADAPVVSIVAEAEATPQAAEAPVEETLLLADRQRRGCIYCALDVDADSAFDPETGTYAFSAAEDAERRSAEQLAEYYLQLVQAEPLLRMLVRPFSPRDPAFEAARSQLLLVLPQRVAVLEDVDAVAEKRGAAPAGLEDSQEAVVPSHGFVRDLPGSVLGLIGQYQEQTWLFNCAQSLYDFDAHRELLPMAASYLSVSLTLPVSGRKFILPKGSSAAELDVALRPLTAQLRGLAAAAYRQAGHADTKEKSSIATLAQFTAGLRSAGYEEAESHAEPIFRYVDFYNRGFIFFRDLVMIEHVSGPATMQELDEFRIWLCEWNTARSRWLGGAAVDADGEATQHALDAFLQRMDPGESGKVPYPEFKKALKKMKHPWSALSHDGRLRDFFMCFDFESTGTTRTKDLALLCLYSARHQLARVSSVRAFLQERFGSLRAAFKALDEANVGTITGADWAAKLESNHGFKRQEDLRACFHFLDKERTRIFTIKDFEALGNFSEPQFLEALRELRSRLAEKCGGPEEAYAAFARGGSDPRARGLVPKDFLNGCRALGLKPAIDARLLFSFLDALRVGRVRPIEFELLWRLDCLDDFRQASEGLRGAFRSLKAFAVSGAEEAGVKAGLQRLARAIRGP